MFPIRDHNPAQARPWVTWSLIAINVAIYLWMVVTLDTGADLARLYYDWAMIPARLSQAENPVALVSALFLHGGLLHLAGNMLFLFIFGDNLEEQMGHGAYLGFYLASGVAANLAQFGAEPFSPIPTIGASGAIAGVMGGYLLLFPRARIDILVFLIVILKLVPVPAWAVLVVWFGLQVLGGIGMDASTGGVAYWAHAGGFAAGLALTLPVWLRRGGPAFWTRTHGVPPHTAAAIAPPARPFMAGRGDPAPGHEDQAARARTSLANFSKMSALATTTSPCSSGSWPSRIAPTKPPASVAMIMPAAMSQILVSRSQ